MTEDKKFRTIVWTRQPVRKIRFRDSTEKEILDLRKALSSGNMTELHGSTNAGWFVMIPADNIAYIEAHEK